jgi:leucyl/phenylalanyl-tRNA---protein transferase
MSRHNIYNNADGTMPHPLLSDEYGFLCHAPMNDVETLLLCYRYGIFPWDNFQHIGAFYFPRKRYMIVPSEIKVPKSINAYFNQNKFTITIDTHFADVMFACRHVKRKDQASSWISSQFESSYAQLHALGYAHSLEVWQGNHLVGGLYGVAIGKVFTGESMFGLVSNAARFAMISLARYLVKHDFDYIDCQVQNQFLETFGGQEYDCHDFFNIMRNNLSQPDMLGMWR